MPFLPPSPPPPPLVGTRHALTHDRGESTHSSTVLRCVSPPREGNPRTGTTKPLLASSSRCASHSAPVSRCDPFRLVPSFKVAGASSASAIPLLTSFDPSQPICLLFSRKICCSCERTEKRRLSPICLRYSPGDYRFPSSTERECVESWFEETVLPCWRFFLSFSFAPNVPHRPSEIIYDGRFDQLFPLHHERRFEHDQCGIFDDAFFGLTGWQTYWRSIVEDTQVLASSLFKSFCEIRGKRKVNILPNMS